MSGFDYLAAYRGKSVLVTGGAGSIGSNLCRALAEAGANVSILDDLSSADLWNVPVHSAIRFCEGDILDDACRSQVFKARPTIVFHLAALFANQHSIEQKEKDLMVNGMGTLRMLESARDARVQRFVYSSSGCSVYGNGAPLPLLEDLVSLHLSSPYQITKTLGELYCNFYYEHYGVLVVKARLFNSYGPGEVPGQYRNVIPNFIYWAMKRQPLPITGTGEEMRDFTYVGDIVDGLLRSGVMENAVGQEFNLGSGSEVRILDLAAMINEAVDNPAGVEYIPRRSWDKKKRNLASIERAGNLIGYQPKTRFAEGLLQTVQWFRDNWSNIDSSARFPQSAAPVTASIMM